MPYDRKHSSKECTGAMNSVKDALYVLSGKWKLPLILALSEGPMRFNEVQKALADITPKVLSKELRDLELNEFVERKVFDTVPVTVTYELTPYSQSVWPIIDALKEWGSQHRERIIKTRRTVSTTEKA
ncbi:transcriptional regulator [Mucilaginibacter terrenus]|uniref:Transcriptional regulator n=1 Tax=Mucilaginibacter terrenus TaxID=2482727 RepID=A0A3E2NUN0_9SPHI|nr:helix-turn-helix domain-containing protein [Mucilaginibacter terrenus]RFZ84641.1 transcriptional regulator [Mucilaginibacter terrenus]